MCTLHQVTVGVSIVRTSHQVTVMRTSHQVTVGVTVVCTSHQVIVGVSDRV
jgi:hypothetical protein